MPATPDRPIPADGSAGTAVTAVTLRRAGPVDAGEIAEVYLASFHARYAFPLAHTDDQVRAWFRDQVESARETWVAAADGAIVGIMVLAEGDLDQLYVDPGWWGRGIGSRLVDLAKERRPDGLELYTFQENDGARAFYERRGFSAVAFGDGSGNEEGQPDVRYAWRPGA